MSRPGTKIYRLREALLELLAEHRREEMLPTSSRFLFYELVGRGIVSKHSEGARRPDQDMNDALTSLREDGSIPWGWIVDETRSIDDYSGYDSVKEGLEAHLDYIKLDPWNGDEPLVLTESRSLAGVLRSLCSDYRAKIAATNGQCGGALHTIVGPALKPDQQVLYLGDLDLAGRDRPDRARQTGYHAARTLRGRTRTRESPARGLEAIPGRLLALAIASFSLATWMAIRRV
jgi:hypothetical protein